MIQNSKEDIDYYYWVWETEQFSWWFLSADRHLNDSPQYLQW